MLDRMQKTMWTSFYTDDEQDAKMRYANKVDRFGRVLDACVFLGIILLVLGCCFRAAHTGENPVDLFSAIALFPYMFVIAICTPIAIFFLLLALICGK